MKKIIFILLIIHSSLLIVEAQWQPDIRLTNASGDSFTSNNNAWSIATNGDVLHVVWWDFRDGNWEIYYKRSTDGGTSWGADTRLTNASNDSWNPSVSVSGQLVHVVWMDRRDGNYEIYYKRSTDGGVSWGADTRLTNNPAISGGPSVSVSGAVVYVAWHDSRNGGNEIYYKRSTDGGSSWETDTRLTNDPANSIWPSVSVFGQAVHVVWFDSRNGAHPEIYYKRSTDGGISWGADTRLTNDPAISAYPCISVSGQVVHVVWYDERDSNYEIYYKRSTDGGVNWGAETRLTNSTYLSQNPSVSASGQAVHVVWFELLGGNYEVYYKRSTDGGVSWEADTRLTNDPAYSTGCIVSVSGAVVHVVWTDLRDGNSEIYYKRNPSGNPVGITNINSDIPKEFSLHQNYPNPFNPSTNIKFDIPKSSFVRISVYDISGKEISVLVNTQLLPGSYQADWNASNYSSGVYYYTLTAGHYYETKKMILIK
jgi:hypothetical protein